MFWLGAIISLCYIPGLTGAYIATQWPLLAVLMPFWLLKKGPFTAYHALGLAFVVYAVAARFFSPLPDISVFGVWLVVITGMCMWFGTVMEDMRELYKGLAIGASVSSVVAVLQYLGWSNVPMTGLAPAGIYVNGVQQGLILALVAVALASERMWLWMLPLAPGLVLAHSRGAWLALAVGLLACYVRRIWVFSAVAVAGVLYLFVWPLNSADSERMLIWNTAYSALTWFGIGPGVFYAIVIPRDGTMFFPEYVHNDALQLTLEYGIGALFVCAIFARALSVTQAKEWPIVVAFVTAGCYSMPLFMPLAAFLAFAAVGRVLRVNALACRNRNCSRQHVLSRYGRYAQTCGAYFSMAPHHPAKG